MFNPFRWFKRKDRLFGAVRSPKWKRFAKDYLSAHPTCEMTGTTKKVRPHHILPVHLYPELELDPENVMSLSDAKIGGVKPHLFCGHLGFFGAYNPNVREDAQIWLKKIKERPYTKVDIK